MLDLARTGADLKAAVSFHGVLDRLGATPDDSSVEFSKTSSARPRTQPMQPPLLDCNSSVNPRIVVFHGYADPFTPPERLQAFMSELEEREARYEVRVSGSGVLHSFTRPEKNSAEDESMGMQYNEHVDRQSWDSTLALLRETLG